MLDIIKKQRMMQASVALLVILNLALITSMIINKPPRMNGDSPHQGPGIFLEKELGLDASQLEALHGIREQHFDNAQPILESLSDSLESLIAEAFKPSSDSTRVNELAQNISDIHLRMDLALYNHFVQLNALCTPEQQIQLKAIAGKLIPGNSQPPPQGQAPEGRPPHPDGRGQDRRPPPPGQGPGRGAPPPRDR